MLPGAHQECSLERNTIMPLPTPQLDDRSFSALVATLQEQIPGYSRAWTDFNPSDAGITLLELWCWLAEMILYRMNQIPSRSTTNFLQLILDPPEPVTAEVTLTLRPRNRPAHHSGGNPFCDTASLVSAVTTKRLRLLLENGRLIFETYQPVEILAATPTVSFPVRSRVVVRNEELGVSSGQPESIFYLKQGPVLLDLHNTGSGGNPYNPNPRHTGRRMKYGTMSPICLMPDRTPGSSWSSSLLAVSVLAMASEAKFLLLGRGLSRSSIKLFWARKSKLARTC